MKKKKTYLRHLIFLMVILSYNLVSFSQGSGGPGALPNAFAGNGPPPPGGGGGGGQPIAEIPLDSDSLILLVMAGILYWIFHKRNVWFNDKKNEPSMS